jgi:hypothetical protein
LSDEPIFKSTWNDFWQGNSDLCDCGCGKYILSRGEIEEDYVVETYPPRCQSERCNRYLLPSDFNGAGSSKIICNSCRGISSELKSSGIWYHRAVKGKVPKR